MKKIAVGILAAAIISDNNYYRNGRLRKRTGKHSGRK